MLPNDLPNVSIDEKTDSRAIPYPEIAALSVTLVKDLFKYFFANIVWILDRFFKIPDNENNIHKSIIPIELISVLLSIDV